MILEEVAIRPQVGCRRGVVIRRKALLDLPHMPPRDLVLPVHGRDDLKLPVKIREEDLFLREEWAELAAAAGESADTGTVSMVVFRIGPQWLALETTLFERWLAARPVHVVPGLTNDVFRGLVNVDGELLFCFDGPKMLGFEESGEEAPGRMFVAASASDRFVFAVQEVLGVRRIAREALEELPATLARSPAALTRATAAVENRKVGLLDANKFFACALRSLP